MPGASREPKHIHLYDEIILDVRDPLASRCAMSAVTTSLSQVIGTGSLVIQKKR